MTIVTVDEFISDHIAEHRSKLNQACHLIGYAGMTAGALMAVIRSEHRFLGMEVLLAGFGIQGIGHIVERNLVRALQIFVKHPVWTVRGDITVMRGLFRRSG